MLPVSVRLYALAAVLIVAAIGLEVRRRNVLMRERSRYGLLKDDVELFHDALATSLRNPESCRQVLGKRKLNPDAVEPIELDYVFDPATPGPLRAGGDAWAGTQLKTLNLRLPAQPDVRTRYKGHPYRRFRARLEAEFVVADRFSRGIPAATEFFVWLNADSEVEGCFGPLSVGSVCNMMGGYYDVNARGTDPRCHQVVNTVVGSGDTEAFRGSCRVNGLVDRASACASRRGALPFQDKVGFGTSDRVLCRVCE